MSFDYPWLLLLLLLTIPIVLLWLRSVNLREARMKKFSESAFTEKIFVGNNQKLRFLHFILFTSATILVLGAISGPEITGGKQKVKTTGIDIMVALDVSNSMRANDIQPNRLERAKLALNQMISKLGSDRVGIVVFAGQAYTCLPLTDDYPAAEMVMGSVSTDMVSSQGTAIGLAIDNATNAFSSSDKDRGKAIILISDGENHEDDATAAAKRANEKGVIVCTVGIGSADGSTIPEFDSQGNSLGNKRDENGKEVITKLDEAGLKEIANVGRGIYVKATSADLGIEKVYQMLQNLSKTEKESWIYSSYTPIFHWMILLAILLFIVESLLPQGKKQELNTRRS